ncbi:unnamed protein product [Durusdinium trenchii]|uniref:Uncharacterized protein n=2 Tax=Durusdinium trenchii TaxID=1381693 RepID=A0ABP0QRL6_9DINO
MGLGMSASAPIEVPTLQFTVKADCPALSKGPVKLKVLHSTGRFGIKIVRICGKAKDRTFQYPIRDYPDAEDELDEGYDCWMMPHLLNSVELTDEAGRGASRLLQAYEHIYQIDPKTKRICVQEGGHEGLMEFMHELDLQEEDLTCDFLPARPIPYTSSRAASICTEPFAENLVLHLRKLYWMSACQPALESIFQHLGMLEERKLGLRVLNMRHNFKISPIAVVHGGRETLGWWDLPEKTTTILCPGDRLIFLVPSHELADADFKNSIERLNCDLSPTTGTSEQSLEDGDLSGFSMVKPVKPRQKSAGRKPRRSTGKMKKLKKQILRKWLEVVRQGRDVLSIPATDLQENESNLHAHFQP